MARITPTQRLTDELIAIRADRDLVMTQRDSALLQIEELTRKVAELREFAAKQVELKRQYRDAAVAAPVKAVAKDKPVPQSYDEYGSYCDGVRRWSKASGFKVISYLTRAQFDSMRAE